MAINNTSLYSTESVSYQSGSPLFKALIEVTKEHQAFVSTLKNGRRYYEPSRDEMEKFHREYEKVIAKHTGLNVQVDYDPDISISSKNVYDYNAFAELIILTPDTPLLPVLSQFNGSADIGEYIEEAFNAQKKLQGMVDRKKSRVYGDFTKLKTKIIYNKPILAILSPEEFSAVLLHEIGHVFSSFDMLIRTTLGNMVIMRAAEALTKAKDVKTKHEILNISREFTGIDEESANKLLEQEMSAEGYSTVLVSSYILTKLRSDTQSYYHDTTLVEFAAEEFAIMHGAGRYALMALEKITDGDFIKRFKVNMFFNVLQIAAYIASTALYSAIFTASIAVGVMHGQFLSAAIAGVLFLIRLLHDRSDLRFNNLIGSTYASPFVIATRFRGTLIQALKQKDLPMEDRRHILKEIEYYDAILKTGKYGHKAIEVMYMLISPTFSAELKQREKQILLEELINNSLFSRAEKFDQLLLK